MSKLRTEYVKNLGIELTIFDSFDSTKEFITHFATRKNPLKIQPAGDNIPIICDLHTVIHCSDKAKDINWLEISSWAPNYSKLLKMQDIHDKEIINRSEK